MTTSIDDTGTMVLLDGPIALDALAAAVAAIRAQNHDRRKDVGGQSYSELKKNSSNILSIRKQNTSHHR